MTDLLVYVYLWATWFFRYPEKKLLVVCCKYIGLCAFYFFAWIETVLSIF